MMTITIQFVRNDDKKEVPAEAYDKAKELIERGGGNTWVGPCQIWVEVTENRGNPASLFGGCSW